MYEIEFLCTLIVLGVCMVVIETGVTRCEAMEVGRGILSVNCAWPLDKHMLLCRCYLDCHVG